MTREINEENIRVAAYYIWEQAGRPEGKDKECWIKACEQLFAVKAPKKVAKKASKTIAKAVSKPAAKVAKPAAKKVVKPVVKAAAAPKAPVKKSAIQVPAAKPTKKIRKK